MRRKTILALFAACFAALTAGTAYADSAEVERCVRTKVRAAASQGQGVDLTAVRALCRQIEGDGARIQGSDVLSPGNGAEITLLEDRCRAYARDAVEQANYGAQNCGYSGPRYTLYESDHRDWCKGVPAELSGSEQQARRREVDACKFCQMYKDKAVEQFNRKGRCLSPVSGPEWTELPAAAHFNWCLIQEPGREARANPDAFNVTAKRNAGLDACMQAPVLR